MVKKSIQTRSVDETHKVSKEVAHKLKNGGILLLFGDLGSGKTTFTQGFAKEIGVTRNIISPTFILMRTYEIPEKKEGKFYHIDLYRTTSERDREGLGIREVLSDPENIVVIEWAERLGSSLPEKRTELHFTYMDENTRMIEEIVYNT